MFFFLILPSLSPSSLKFSHSSIQHLPIPLALLMESRHPRRRSLASLPDGVLLMVAMHVASSSPKPFADIGNLKLSTFRQVTSDRMVERCIAVDREYDRMTWGGLERKERYITFVRRCSDAGNSEANCILGVQLLSTHGERYAGISRLLGAKESGHEAAAYILGMLYFQEVDTRVVGVELLNMLATGCSSCNCIRGTEPGCLILHCRRKTTSLSWCKTFWKLPNDMSLSSCANAACGRVIGSAWMPDDELRRTFCNPLCRVLCKFFAHGACLKGENCEFSHDWKDQPHNICTFYQKGACSYGSRCRYDHVKISRCQISHPPSSSNSHSQSQVARICEVPGYGRQTSSSLTGLSALSAPYIPSTKVARTQSYEPQAHADIVSGYDCTSVYLAEPPICSFAAAGKCPHGRSCPHIHGDLCSICGKHCLHPHCPDEREKHIKLCERNKKRLEVLRQSQEIECSVCLDCVLSKTTAAERKFGLLSECDHPFCISCIRNWRNNSPSSGMDVNTALRSCPICRKLSYFVIPSVTWYSTKEEKQEIIDSYKNKLRSIDCKYFEFGNGACPFGTSCFYKHTYKPQANRSHMHRLHANRSNTYWPQIYRPREVASQELGSSLRRRFLEEELEDLSRQIDEESENSDGENLDNLVNMSFLLTHLGFDEWGSSSEDDCWSTSSL